MRGSIKQRTYADPTGKKRKCKVWSVRYSPPCRVGELRKFYIKSGFETKRDAEKWFDAKKAEFANGVVSDGRTTVESYLKQWLAGLRRQSSATGKPTASTLHAYTNHVEKHIIPALGAIRLSDLQPKDIEDAMHRWRTSAAKRRKAKAVTVTQRTVANIFGTLRSALRKAKKQRIISVNLCELVDPPTMQRPERKWLDADAALALLEKLGEDPVIGAAVTMALGTGLRRGELLGLTWGDVDFKQGVVAVQRSVERVNGHTRTKEPKTPESASTIPLSTFVAERLRRHRKEQHRRFAAASLGKITPETPVFDYAGGFWVPNTFGSAWMRALREAGIAHIRLHALRHSFGGILLENGTDLKTIQSLMRHTDYRTTANIYLHRSERLNREAIARLDEALKVSAAPRRQSKATGRVYSSCTVAPKTIGFSQISGGEGGSRNSATSETVVTHLTAPL